MKMEEKSAYGKLCELEQEGLTTVLNRWKAVAEHNGKSSDKRKVMLSNMLWTGPQGSGRSYILKLLGQFLEELHIPMSVVEITLPYVLRELSFQSTLDHFSAKLSASKGYANEYEGIVSVDISDWLSHQDDAHFHRFLQELLDHRWLIIFHVVDGVEEEICDLVATINTYFACDVMKLTHPNEKRSLNFIVDRLENEGINISSECEDILKETIARVRNADGFRGYRTWLALADSLIFAVQSSRISKDATLKIAIAKFEEKINYKKNKQRHPIGFGSDWERGEKYV